LGVEKSINLFSGVLGMTEQISEIDRVTLRVREACHIFSLSRSELYRRIGSGDIEAIKIGRSTLIVKDSVLRWLSSLPRLKDKSL